MVNTIFKMQTPILIQLRHESSAYKRLTRFMSEETVAMKNRLTEILQNDIEKEMLDSFEYFQNEFLKTDEIIGYIRNNIAELDNCLVAHEQNADGIKEAKILRGGLCKKILVAKNRLTDLQIKFNDFLLATAEK